MICWSSRFKLNFNNIKKNKENEIWQILTLFESTHIGDNLDNPWANFNSGNFALFRNYWQPHR